MSRLLDPDVLRPSGALLSTHLRLAVEIEARAVEPSRHPDTVLDLLVRLDLAPERVERASRLCDQLNLSAAHMSRTIDRAEAAGLVQRRPDSTDRRAQIVALTPAGDEVLADFAPRLHRLLHTVIHDVLGDDEVETLISMLERIQAACDALPANDLEENSRA